MIYKYVIYNWCIFRITSRMKFFDLADFSWTVPFYACNRVMAVDEIKSSPVAASAFFHSANELSRSCLFRQFHACGICRARSRTSGGWRARTRRTKRERVLAPPFYSHYRAAIGRQEDGYPYGTFSIYCPRTLAVY